MRENSVQDVSKHETVLQSCDFIFLRLTLPATNEYNKLKSIETKNEIFRNFQRLLI